MAENIVFLGIKHCGKSTQGRLLASRLQWDFLDTDEMLEQSYQHQYNCTAAEAAPRAIMQKHGEGFFRRFEAAVIRDFLSEKRQTKAVIALGGGVPCNDFLSIQELKALGTLICLNTDMEVAFKRIAAGGIPPFLQGDDPHKKFMELYRKRMPRYLQIADMVIEANNESAAGILSEKIYNTLLKEKILDI